MIEIKEKEGWKLNPDEKITNSVIKALTRNNGLCPCVHDTEDYEGKDLHCPCTDYLDYDKCCCGLYIKK